MSRNPPVYPNAQIERVDTSVRGAGSGQALSTDNSFDTVYAWYKKNLPGGSERSAATSPEKTAVFFVGPVSNRLSVTITSSLRSKTVIVIARAKS